MNSRIIEELMLEYAEVDRWIHEQRARGRVIGFTCGAFDLLHAGHVDYLEEARAQCDALLVAVNSDASIRRYKSGLRPVVPQDQRMRVVAALRAVDAVTLLENDRPVELLRRWQPDLYIKGGDYAAGELRSAPEVEAYGGRAVLIPIKFPTSTSELIEKAALLNLHQKAAHDSGPSAGIVFLDRDGTLIRNIPFLNSVNRVDVLPGTAEALLALQNAGFRLVIVTNQQGIGLGYVSHDQFIAINRELLRQLAPGGIRIAKILFCPHSMADECTCRKPQATLLEQAMAEYGVNRQQCYFIGDSEDDRGAAAVAGVAYFAVGPGASISEAAEQILEHAQSGRYAKQ